MPNPLKRTLVGHALTTTALSHERLSKAKALAILASDALSSVAYASEEIILVLGTVALAGATNLSVGIAVAITLLLVVVGLSFRQTIHAYPEGGGSYIVARENLGAQAGLLAAAALMIDYVTTVAVSVAAGVAALAAALPAIGGHRELIALALISLITVANLRGGKETATLLAVPTYAFLAAILATLGVGAVRLWHGTLPTVAPVATPALAAVGWFVILRAFSSGCTTMTGIEAISSGVPAFAKPEARNAGTTLGWLVGLLAVMFVGITTLAHAMGIGIRPDRTLLAQVTAGVFGEGWLFQAVQLATLAILVMAANSSYADFPRLSSMLARDGYLPRQLSGRGDRLVFTNGILLLGFFAILLTIVFGANTHALIPLYAVGVFLSFTLSQAGMVVHGWRRRERNSRWLARLAVSGLGAGMTAVVTGIIAVTKFAGGAWLVVGLVPLLVLLFRKIHAHYQQTNTQLSLQGTDPAAERSRKMAGTSLLLVSSVHRGVLGAMRYLQTLGTDVRAVYVDLNGDGALRLKTIWQEWGQGVPLVVLDSPHRSITEPLIAYIDRQQIDPERVITVVIPEFVTSKWWEHALHNQTAFLIKWALLFCRRRVIVTSVPQFLT